jgi:hypothetical protein
VDDGLKLGLGTQNAGARLQEVLRVVPRVEAHEVARQHALEQLRTARKDFVDLARREGDVQKEACDANGSLSRQLIPPPGTPPQLCTHVGCGYLLANGERHQHQVVATGSE